LAVAPSNRLKRPTSRRGTNWLLAPLIARRQRSCNWFACERVFRHLSTKFMLRYLFVILMLSSALVLAENASTKFNVCAFGAIGDGVADDQPAITKAVVALTHNKGGTLEFPRGIYRCARQSGMQNAIEIVGISNVTISFEPGAVLLMDNLNPQSGMGDFEHGIVFRDPSHGNGVSPIQGTFFWTRTTRLRSIALRPCAKTVDKLVTSWNNNAAAYCAALPLRRLFFENR
jgi:hypothetical protein